jgi:hypothetical protein
MPYGGGVEGNLPRQKQTKHMSTKYNKIRFTSKSGSTAGLVIESAKLASMNIAEVSRLFPVREFPCMIRFECSPDMETWDSAFSYVFIA